MNKLSICVKSKPFRTAPDLYGVFFEDINRSADSGLYTEMIRNRAFEDALPPPRCELDEEGKFFTTPTGWSLEFNQGEGLSAWEKFVEPDGSGLPGWYAESPAQMELETTHTLNENRRANLSVDFPEEGAAIYNVGFGGMYVKPGEQYDFYMFAKAPAPIELAIELRSEFDELLADDVVLVTSKEYARIDSRLTARGGCINAKFYIRAKTAGSLRIGFISLMPRDTIHGLRRDLVEMLRGLSPKFLRFPGGCIVEGFTKETGLHFHKTLGPVWERESTHNLWCYLSTNGLGYHEYLTLCEDLGAHPMYVVNCGMSCQARCPEFFEGEELDELVEEAINAVLYANAPVGTEWGDKRAANGHPEPFNMKYLEIGNENFKETYNERYLLFYNALKERFPDLILISNTHTERDGLPTEVVDEHFYADQEYFTALQTRYDNYDRKGPKVFVGEYAITSGKEVGTLQAALAEAAFLIGVERNQDIVTLTAYAPLFLHDGYMSWGPDLIVFNNRETYGIPSYHMLAMMGRNRGDWVVETELDCPSFYFPVSGCMGGYAEKPGAEFKNISMNGVICDDVTSVPGRTGNGGMFGTGTGEAVSISPEAYFICGDKDAVIYTAEADVKFSKDNTVGFSVWIDHRPGGYLVEGVDNWTFESLNTYQWRFEDGKSSVVVGRGKRLELFSGPVDVDLDYDAFQRLKIVTTETTIKCYLNGKLIHTLEARKTPVLSACATFCEDKNELIVKLVNLSEQDEDVTISLDKAPKGDGTLEILTAPDPLAKNNFENKNRVSPKTGTLKGMAEKFIYTAPASSFSILKIPMK